VPELEARGDRAVVMDLPVDDVDATWNDYADTVIRALDGVDDPVVVGHSLAGLVIPLVAARRPARALVYLCSIVPSPGWTVAEELYPDTPQTLADPSVLVIDDQGRAVYPAEHARAAFYDDCDDRTVAYAIPRLRPQAPVWLSPWNLERMPGAPSHAIVCTDDKMVNPAWSRRAAPDKLGVVPIELPGGHSPFFSCPQALADELHGIGGGRERQRRRRARVSG
jgi:pimeloyl-ACP methyl ester carboxylesterase